MEGGSKMYDIFMVSHWPDVNIGLHNNRMMLQSNGKVSSVIRQSDKSTVSQERMRKLCLVPPFCVLCSTWYMYRGVASSWRKRTNGKEKTIGSRAQLTHTHTHTQLPPGAEGRPPQTLKHTHPAGFLFQSYLLVDAGRTSWEFILFVQLFWFLPRCDVLKDCGLKTDCITCYCFRVARGRAALGRTGCLKKKVSILIMKIQVDFIVLSGFV